MTGSKSSKRNKYVGPSSCYAVKEGAWVRDEPGELGWGELPGILALILRDYARGWSYGDSCERVRMDRKLFERRARYAGALASAGRPRAERSKIMAFVERVVRAGRIPRGFEVRLEGEGAAELARELEELGIVDRPDLSVRRRVRARA